MFSAPVSIYMSLEPLAVRTDASLEAIAEKLDRYRISAMPVVDHEERAVGVVSRRDLLRVGRLELPQNRKVAVWELPDQTAADVMSEHILSVAPNTSLSEAAALMLDNHVHRVFVEINRELRGVLTTRDVMQAIVEHRLDAPIRKLMSHPAQTIATFEPLGVARRQLEELKVRGLVVAEEGYPVGIFDEVDALASRHRSDDLAVERVMGHEVLIQGPKTPAYRAAAQMASMHARRIVVMEDASIVGVLTGFDLAGAAAMS